MFKARHDRCKQIFQHFSLIFLFQFLFLKILALMLYPMYFCQKYFTVSVLTFFFFFKCAVLFSTGFIHMTHGVSPITSQCLTMVYSITKECFCETCTCVTVTKVQKSFLSKNVPFLPHFSAIFKGLPKLASVMTSLLNAIQKKNKRITCLKLSQEKL